MKRAHAHHEWREVDLFEQLHDEFGDRVDPQFLQVVAREEAGSFDDAKIRDFVPLIAYRQARTRVIRRILAGGTMTGPPPYR
jgi:hypothetical protein